MRGPNLLEQLALNDSLQTQSPGGLWLLMNKPVKLKDPQLVEYARRYFLFRCLLWGPVAHGNTWKLPCLATATHPRLPVLKFVGDIRVLGHHGRKDS